MKVYFDRVKKSDELIININEPFQYSFEINLPSNIYDHSTSPHLKNGFYIYNEKNILIYKGVENIKNFEYGSQKELDDGKFVFFYFKNGIHIANSFNEKHENIFRLYIQINNTSFLKLNETYKYYIYYALDEWNDKFEITGKITPSTQTRKNVKPWDLLNNNKVRSSKELKEKRLSICSQCPRLKSGVCMECGCIMKLKTSLLEAYCPLEKW